MHLAPLCIWASETACGIAELGSVRAVQLVHYSTTAHTHLLTYLLTYLLRARGNELVGTLEPLRGCRFLQGLGLACNQITGSLEPLTECTELQGADR